VGSLESTVWPPAKEERDHANRETAIAAAVNRFLTDDLLAQGDPFKSGDAKESFVDTVNQASSRIDLQFNAEPVLAARLHQTIAHAFDGRSDFPLARREYDRANDLFLQSGGPLSQDSILVRLQRATLEARSGEPNSLPLAQSILKDAELSMSRIAQPRGDLAVWILSTRGVIAIIGSDGQTANHSFAEALRRARTIPSFDEAALSKIEQGLAFSYIRLGDGAKAEPLFRELVQTFSQNNGPDSANALRAHVYLSQALLIQGKYADAIKEANLIYPALVKKLGENHEATMSVLGTRAASEGNLNMWDESIRDNLALYNLAVQKQGPVSIRSVGALSDAALSQCRAGRFAEGESNARRAFQDSKQAFGARAGITGGCSYALALCLIGTNKLEEASGLLQNIDIQAVTQLSGDSSVSASVALAQAEIAVRRGDYTLADRYTKEAAPVFERPDANLIDSESLQKIRKAIDSPPARVQVTSRAILL
jgi:hypothetical protein